MAARRYTSAIRDAQVERTREHLLAAARELLEAGGLDGLTLPRLAQAAGVSTPTVYRHFPTLDDLLRAFLDWLRPQLGQTPERLLGAGPDEIARLPLDNYARFEAHAALLQPLMEARAWNRIRVGSMRDRAAGGAAALRPAAPRWADDDLAAAAGAIYALASPQTWRWLRDTWGLDADRAAGAAAWAMRALIGALAGADRPGAPAAARPRTPAPPRARKAPPRRKPR